VENSYESAVRSLPSAAQQVVFACLAEHTVGLFVGATGAQAESDRLIAEIWRLALEPGAKSADSVLTAFVRRVPHLGGCPDPRIDLGMKAGAATLDLFDALRAANNEERPNAAFSIFGPLEVLADIESSDFSGMESYDFPPRDSRLPKSILDEWDRIRCLLVEVHVASDEELRAKHHQYGCSLAARVRSLLCTGT
jgi:hypothetical protein